MANQIDREEQPEEERQRVPAAFMRGSRRGLVVQASSQVHSYPSVPVGAVIDASGIPGSQLEDATVGEAAHQGFKNGLGAGLSAGTPMGALVQIAESVEVAATPGADLEARMERFPELRDVEVPTGNFARFPELAEIAQEEDSRELVEADGFDR